MSQAGALGVWMLLLVLPGQGDVIGNAFVGLTSDLGDEVNSRPVVWAPQISPDGLTLLFTSDRPGGYGGSDLYVATRPDRTARFDRIENLGPPINTAGYEYKGVISGDGLELIYIRDQGEIYTLWRSVRSDPTEPFGAPVPLSAVNGSFTYNAGPSLSQDGLRLFFTSDRPGGRGGSDLWVSERESRIELFGPAILFDDYFPGSPVCSAYDDWNPTITGDNLTLFFSDSWTSNRPGGKGASDIWVSRRANLEEPFGVPVNLNDVSLTSVNSVADELAATVTPDWPRRGAQIFFISTRGGQAIWQATWDVVLEPRISAIPDMGPSPLTVSFDSAGTIVPEGVEPVTFEWDFGDGEWSWDPTAVHTYGAPGRYPVVLTATGSDGISTTASQPVTATCLSGDLAPWTAADVGAPLFPGSAARDGDRVLLCAGGKALWATADEFLFLDQETTGDFTAVFRIIDIPMSEPSAAVGLMVREGREPEARFVAALVELASGEGRFRLRYRPEAGKFTRAITGEATALPAWLRLERIGDLVVARSSEDGKAWVEIGRQTIPGLTATLRCGAAAWGMDSDDPKKPFVPLQVLIDGLEILPPEAVLFLRGDANVDGAADISDAVFVLGHLFLGGTRPTCGKAADMNDDGSIDISDPVFLLTYLFAGGKAPNDPLGSCGQDPTPDKLTCESFARCP